VAAGDEYNEALAGVEVVESDRDILDRLFTMLDRTGEERINHRELIVGVTPFISATTAAKLQFAFEMFDLEDLGKLKHADVRFVLLTLNTVASYFGDPVLRADQVEEVVDEAVAQLDPDKTGYVGIAALCPFVARHQLTMEFLEGSGSARYGHQP